MSGYLNDYARFYRGHKYSVGNYRPGTLERAVAILLEAIRIQPGFAGGYVLLGHVYTEQEKPQEAAAALRKAEELGATNDPFSTVELGSTNRGTTVNAALPRGESTYTASA